MPIDPYFSSTETGDTAFAAEPTDVSFKAATRFAVEGKFDGFVSVGGGSVSDTCKAEKTTS